MGATLSVTLSLTGCMRGNKNGSDTISKSGFKTSDNIADNKRRDSLPNIIFIFADDWGWGDLGIHGHEHLQTPNLDKMASEGTEFYDFYVTNPVCSPSRTSVLTGHFPARHGVHQHFATHEENAQRDMPDWLEPNVVLLPKLLKEAGYTTGHYGKWHLTNSTIVNAPKVSEYGFDDYAVWNAGQGDRNVWTNIQRPVDQQQYPNAYSTMAAVEQTLKFIEKNKDIPFYVNLWIHEGHTAVQATPSDKAKYDGKNIPEPELTYYAALTRADAQIGRILDKIKELDLDENTLIIFSSDNGPESSSKNTNALTYYSKGETAGLRGRKRSLYDGGVRLPFIVRWPGHVPAGVLDKKTTISTVDLLPTFCSLAGVNLPKGYEPDGENMLGALTGKKMQRTKPLFWEWRGFEGVKDGQDDWWPRLGIRDGEWKLYMNYNSSRIELYRHDDWEQKNNLASNNIEKVKELSEKLLEWKKSLGSD